MAGWMELAERYPTSYEAPSTDNHTSKRRYIKVNVEAAKRMMLLSMMKSKLRSRAPRLSLAPLCVPASAPTLLTLPSHLDAPLPMPHVLR